MIEDVGTAKAVALLTVAQEVYSIDADASHQLLEDLLGDLGLEEARLVLDRLLTLTYALARAGDVDLETWLPRTGLAAYGSQP